MPNTNGDNMTKQATNGSTSYPSNFGKLPLFHGNKFITLSPHSSISMHQEIDQFHPKSKPSPNALPQLVRKHPMAPTSTWVGLSPKSFLHRDTFQQQHRRHSSKRIWDRNLLPMRPPSQHDGDNRIHHGPFHHHMPDHSTTLTGRQIPSSHWRNREDSKPAKPRTRAQAQVLPPTLPPVTVLPRKAPPQAVTLAKIMAQHGHAHPHLLVELPNTHTEEPTHHHRHQSAFHSLDQVDLQKALEQKYCGFQSPPCFLKGRFRQALTFALEAILQAHTHEQSVRAWKLWMLLPRMLLHRPPGTRTLSKADWRERIAKFQQDEWTLCYAREECTLTPTRRYAPKTLKTPKSLEQKLRTNQHRNNGPEEPDN